MIKKALVAASLLASTPALADNGMTVGLFGPGFHDMTISYCWLAPWKSNDNNRTTLAVFPEPLTNNRYLWTTDSDMIQALMMGCWLHWPITVYTPDGKTWQLPVSLAQGGPPGNGG